MPFFINNSRGQYHKNVELSDHDKAVVCEILDEPGLGSKETFQNLRQGMRRVVDECFDYSRNRVHSYFIGGDHFTSFATVLSSLKRFGNNFRLIWIDAHTDIHSFQTSASWNLHGMVLRLLMEHNIFGIPQLKPYQIMFIGIRDYEKEEMEFILENKIQRIRASEWFLDKETSIHKLASFILGQNVHVSFDVDVLDPIILNSTGTPVSEGFQVDDLGNIFEMIHKYSRWYFATDIMEYNPNLGDHLRSFETLKNVLLLLKDNNNLEKVYINGGKL